MIEEEKRELDLFIAVEVMGYKLVPNMPNMSEVAYMHVYRKQGRILLGEPFEANKWVRQEGEPVLYDWTYRKWHPTEDPGVYHEVKTHLLSQGWSFGIFCTAGSCRIKLTAPIDFLVGIFEALPESNLVISLLGRDEILDFCRVLKRMWEHRDELQAKKTV